MTTWQPIETAPKTGERILMYDEQNIYIVYWKGVFGKSGYFAISGSEDREVDDFAYVDCGTHWMPLPPAPDSPPVIRGHSEVGDGDTATISPDAQVSIGNEPTQSYRAARGCLPWDGEPAEAAIRRAREGMTPEEFRRAYVGEWPNRAPDVCKWTSCYKYADTMETECGEIFVSNTKFVYCPKCGRKIEVTK